MKRHLMITVASAALVAAGLSAASAQSGRMDNPAASEQPRGGSAQRGETMSPGATQPGGNMQRGSERTPGTTGQAPREERGAQGTQRMDAPGAAKGAETRGSDTKSDMNRGADQRGTGNNAAQNDQRGSQSQTNQRPGAQKDAQGTSSPDKPAQRAGDKPRDDKTVGQGAAAGRGAASVQVNQEQRTRIKQVININNAPKVTNVNFSLSIGTRVPRDRVKLQPVPTQVIEIVPAYRGFLYFVVGSQIVIVDPVDYEIVVVIEA